ncbi:Aste57867_16778 [Aphanomyces stellatus]|uniref:Aste57867_16778 protein n=1 Tax=Aphanomyces stellatus TaxID=120398 RepID=A0A485L673_9STRA|nr:hypothetical protein As57867_016721 [Aphanomyces stellatus]VFT93543.1 Aste57867_16778 [Aphanomyces stellatus]
MAIRKLKARGIGRFELLSWLNEFLETDYTKIEHLADGIAYCQVFDVLYPGKMALQNVNFHAQYEPEYERNLKILERTFESCGIQKVLVARFDNVHHRPPQELAIKKLVKGVFQEHFEFLHWVHDYVHRTYPDAIRTYHAYERREQILQKSADTTVNLNLIPKFSMRNGIYRRSMDDAMLPHNEVHEKQSENNAAVHDVPYPLEVMNEKEQAIDLERSLHHVASPFLEPYEQSDATRPGIDRDIATIASGNTASDTTDKQDARETKTNRAPESESPVEEETPASTSPACPSCMCRAPVEDDDDVECDVGSRAAWPHQRSRVFADSVQKDVSGLLAERKHFLDVLHEIEVIPTRSIPLGLILALQ